MSPQDFITKWGPGGPAFHLNEEQGAQSHFIDLCDVLGVPRPGSEDGYVFEKQTLPSQVLGEARGYADVFKRGAFAWENKAPGKNLDSALKQLLNYSSALSNPPILVVCDRLQIRVQTQFTGHPTEKFCVLLAELAQPDKLAQLRRIWLDAESFRPKITSRDITEEAARSFATLADNLRKKWKAPDDAGGPTQVQDPAGFQAHADDVAHFLTQCLFCFFAEDVGLLPGRMFDSLVNNRNLTSDKLTSGMANLFNVMRDGGMYGNDDIPWFNGGLFKRIKVPLLNVLDVTELRNAAALNWSAIDVSIFGTLFERGLDPSKRSQLGAHYTDPATIMRIIEPVLQRPLLQIWELLAQDLHGLLAKSKRKYDASYRLAYARFVDWLDHLKEFRVLDPACGSGNFLFLGLKALKDIEHQSHLQAAAMGLDREADLVTGPHNMLGIELNEYAAELARVTVWIGELQWRLAHGYEFKKNPVLEPLDNIECRDALLSFPKLPLPLPLGEGGGEGSQNVLPLPLGEGGGFTLRLQERLSASGQREEGQAQTDLRSARQGSPLPNSKDAQPAQMPATHTLRFVKSPPASAPPAPANSASNLGSDPSAKRAGSDPNLRVPKPVAIEATWPKASIVIGNPPFLGTKKQSSELGKTYSEQLRSVYANRIPGFSDLVCYWFEIARKQVVVEGLGAVGLVATNSIRGGANRIVLQSISEDVRIYEAWSDEPWVNNGAAVRVSLIAFASRDYKQPAKLNGFDVEKINADLTSGSLVFNALKLLQNKNCCFIATVKAGQFEIDAKLARLWLTIPNVNGRSSSEVVKRWVNGIDVVRRMGDQWLVDFGCDMSEQDAALYELPFRYVNEFVRPKRLLTNRESYRKYWWLFAEPVPKMRAAVKTIQRQLVTVNVAKHRLFAWLPTTFLADHALSVVARADDTTFGILHSRFHELWSLRMGTSLEDRPRYTPTTCFETFPFPAGLTPQDTASQQTEPVAGSPVLQTAALSKPGLLHAVQMRAGASGVAAFSP